jgi:hypothetical protein
VESPAEHEQQVGRSIVSIPVRPIIVEYDGMKSHRDEAYAMADRRSGLDPTTDVAA